MAVGVFLMFHFMALCSAQNSDVQRGHDSELARHVSNNFIFNIANGHTLDAMAYLDNETSNDSVRRILDLCGRPLDARIARGGAPTLGEDVVNGAPRKTFIFSYVSTRTTRKGFCGKSGCKLAVTVEAKDVVRPAYFVSGFSCLR